MLSATMEAKTRVAAILDNNPGKVFRVSLVGGGCAGFKYDFDLTDPEDDDVVVEESGPHRIVTDPISEMYFANAQLDFKDDIFSKMFVLVNPDVKTTCGCGESIGF